MWNLQDDKELDKLSRDAAENYSMDRSPDSWNKVHLRLEAEMPEERRRRFLLFFLLFLFIGSGAFWISRMYTHDVPEQTLAENSTSSNNDILPNKEESKVESKNVVPNTTSTVKEPTVSNNNKPANEKKV